MGSNLVTEGQVACTEKSNDAKLLCVSDCVTEDNNQRIRRHQRRKWPGIIIKVQLVRLRDLHHRLQIVGARVAKGDGDWEFGGKWRRERVEGEGQQGRRKNDMVRETLEKDELCRKEAVAVQVLAESAHTNSCPPKSPKRKKSDKNSDFGWVFVTFGVEKHDSAFF